MKGILFILAVIACIASGSCEDKKDDDDLLSKFAFTMEKPAKNRTVIESWQNLDRVVRELSNSAVKSLLPFLMDSFMHLNLSKECVQNTMNIVLGVKKIRPWAMRFLDASGKLMDGLLVGSPSSFGNYDECVDTEVRSEKKRDNGKILYRGQYCVINMVPPLPEKKNFYKVDDIGIELQNFTKQNTIVGEIAKNAGLFYFISVRFGVCIPTGCSLNDVNKIAKYVGDMLSINATASRCEVKEENDYNAMVITAISVLSFLVFLVLVGTGIDLYKYYTRTAIKNVMIQTLMAFSIFTNFPKFTNTKTSSDTLSCLNGIRFLCLTWIIIGHTYLTINFQLLISLIQVKSYARDFAFQAIVNASVAVDTFLCMGGLLVCYLTVKLVNEGRKLSIGFFIFHRLWRLYPAYILVMLIVFLGNLIGSGPVWHETTYKHMKACEDNWWTNLLFINNFYDSEHMCIPQSWYIATDFQLYLASLIILLPMLRWPKAGILLTVFAIIVCIFYSGIGTYVNDYPPAMLFAHPDPNQRLEYWARFYFRPFVHVGPYCVGFIAGYILATYPKLKIPLAIQAVGWFLAIATNMSVLYGVFEWNKGVEPTLFSGIMYASLSRTAWSLGIAWMIVCCATGHGGIINYILSWKAFVPLGRLTYVTFLVHPLVQIIFVGCIKTHVQPDHFLAIYLFFGHLFITYFLGFIGTMLIESPCMAIEKLFLPKLQRNLENISVAKEINNIKGSLKTDKDGDIATIVPKTDEETGGVDNVPVVYRL